jgi:CheY-like chemotaxis protein
MILLVEDDPLVRMLAADALSHAGLDVVEAEDAQEALAQLKSVEGISILLTDIGLPGSIDGWELADLATAMKPGLHVVYVTGSDAGDRRTVEGSRFLSKPYSPDALIAICKAFDR